MINPSRPAVSPSSILHPHMHVLISTHISTTISSCRNGGEAFFSYGWSHRFGEGMSPRPILVPVRHCALSISRQIIHIIYLCQYKSFDRLCVVMSDVACMLLRINLDSSCVLSTLSLPCHAQLNSPSPTSIISSSVHLTHTFINSFLIYVELSVA